MKKIDFFFPLFHFGLSRRSLSLSLSPHFLTLISYIKKINLLSKALFLIYFLFLKHCTSIVLVFVYN